MSHKPPGEGIYILSLDTCGTLLLFHYVLYFKIYSCYRQVESYGDTLEKIEKQGTRGQVPPQFKCKRRDLN
jgi:hypothetical protein